MKNPKDLTIADVERAIKTPTKEWNGNCYFVAVQIIEKRLIEGKAVYGHYRGPVATTGYWKSRASQSIIRHGWIELPDETILDPTRWSFEDVKPYLHRHECGNHDFVCRVCGMVPEEHGEFDGHPDACLMFTKQRCDYDAGGNELRLAMMRPCPAYRTATKEDIFSENNTRHMKLKITPGTLKFMKEELLKGTPHVTWEQLHWIANLPLNMLGERAAEIYKAIEKADEASIIPIDNRTAILGHKS